jgi:hypothetical protein
VRQRFIKPLQKHDNYLRSNDKKNKGGKKASTLSDFGSDVLNELFSDYRKILLRYVRSMRTEQKRPIKILSDFAKKLIAYPICSRDVVNLHIRVINDLNSLSDMIENDKLNRDARLVLVNLMGALLDISLTESRNYLSTKKTEIKE